VYRYVEHACFGTDRRTAPYRGNPSPEGIGAEVDFLVGSFSLGVMSDHAIVQVAGLRIRKQ
jgi:hypothetical protein